MYLRNGKQMEHREEGAAFFEPITMESELGMVPPRTMGLQPGMLTHGFVQTPGMGEDPPAEPSYMDKVAAMNPWVVGGVAVALGFGGTYLWRKR